jgi:hypothetical protein
MTDADKLVARMVASAARKDARLPLEDKRLVDAIACAISQEYVARKFAQALLPLRRIEAELELRNAGRR